MVIVAFVYTDWPEAQDENCPIIKQKTENHYIVRRLEKP